MKKMFFSKMFFSIVWLSLLLTAGQALSPQPLDSPGDPGKAEKYSYTLAPDKTDKTDEYTRREIESFLCACSLGYIGMEDLSKTPAIGVYFVKTKKNFENQKKVVENQDINKWFEDQVTVTSKGNLTVLDIETIEGFFKKVNQVIGKEKFLYTPGLEVANIIIELAPPGKFVQLNELVGETFLLEDNLGIRITTSDEDPKPHIETYNTGSAGVIVKSENIKLTPRELEFRQNNRLVKVAIKNILDPHTRYFAFIHELFHSLGFIGHSPYQESLLFPLPVRVNKAPLPGFGSGGSLFTELAQSMVEMLYRPEILPGMTVKEAGEVLTRIKRIDKTPKDEMISYLLERKTPLENQKKAILEKEEKEYNLEMKEYIELDRLIMKEIWYLEELEEIRTDYRREAQIVRDIDAAASNVEKLVRIRQELILDENQKKRLLEKPGSLKNEKEARNARRELQRLGEEIVVLNDLLEVEKKIAAFDQNILAETSSPGQKQAIEELRRILRQLYTIDKELQGLHR